MKCGKNILNVLEINKSTEDFIKELLRFVLRDCIDLLVDLFMELSLYAEENKNEPDKIILDFVAEQLKYALAGPLSRATDESK